ncbi:MAG: tRNA (adenosine(37)-N6)-dimethylallyltransferase MiaA [bacterium]
MRKKSKLIVILGPTASGKTKLAVKLAAEFNGEIVSADSRQVYRGMDIGTGKDLGEYEVSFRTTKNSGKVIIPHHLIDVVSPKTQFSLAKYQKLAYKAINDIIARGKTPFLVGGSGLYIQSVVDGMPLLEAKPDWGLREILEKWDIKELFKELKKLDPLIDEEMIQGNKRRIIRYIEIIRECKKPLSQLWEEQKKEAKYDCLLLGVLPKPHPIPPIKGEGTKSPSFEEGGRERLWKKIDKRVDSRLEEGMVEEVLKLHKKGISWQRLESFGLEYKFISQYLQGKLEYQEMVNLLKIAVHQFAKRQMTWFKRDKRIKWISGYGEVRMEVKKFIRKKNH